MHVCIVYRDSLQAGGYPRDARWLAGALSAQGVDVSLIARPGDILDGVGSARLVPMDEGAKAIEDADVVHMLGMLIPSQFRLLPEQRGAKTVISPLGQLMWPHIRRRWLKKLPYFAYLRARLARRSLAYHLFSDEERAGMRYFAPGRCAFEATVGLFPVPGERKGSGRGVGARYLLYFGRNDVYQKGIDRLLHGYAIAADRGLESMLVVAGRPERNSVEYISRRIKELRLESRIHLLGSVEEADKWTLLRHAEALVFLSRWDGPPRPVREAIAVGTPVIVSSGTNMSAIVERGLAGASVGAANPNVVADVLLMSENESVPELWREGVRTLSSQLQWSSVSLQYVEGYERVLSGDIRP